jgi:pyruvate/2-oxoglutarate/acetoin dehydrogenase E1 component
MAAMTMVQALNSAMDVMLGRDPDVVIFGDLNPGFSMRGSGMCHRSISPD